MNNSCIYPTLYVTTTKKTEAKTEPRKIVSRNKSSAVHLQSLRLTLTSKKDTPSFRINSDFHN